MICVISARSKVGSKLPRSRISATITAAAAVPIAVPSIAPSSPPPGGQDREQRPAPSSGPRVSAITNATGRRSSQSDDVGELEHEPEARQEPGPAATSSSSSGSPSSSVGDRHPEDDDQHAPRPGRGSIAQSEPGAERVAAARSRRPLVLVIVVVVVVAAAEGAPDRPRLDQQREQLRDQAGEEEQQREAADLARAEVGGDDQHRDELRSRCAITSVIAWTPE